MADVQTYDDLPYTQFPVDVDTFEDMQDVSLDTYGWVKQYNEYFASGNIKSAQALLAAHPELQKCIFNALKINRMSQAIKAMERFYKEDITRVVENAAKNSVGINDNPTEEQEKITSFSGKKINELFETMGERVDKLAEMKNAVIELSTWTGSGPWTAVLSVDSISENDHPIVSWNNTAGDITTKKQQQKSWNMVDECQTGDGTLTFVCKFKKPLVDIPIAIKGR